MADSTTIADDQSTAIALNAFITPSPTPTDNGSFIVTCFQEQVDQTQNSCTSVTSQFTGQAWQDIALQFYINNPNSYNLSSIQWRVFKQNNNNAWTSLGSYSDNTIDPQNNNLTWSVASLFGDVTNTDSVFASTGSGTYKIEVLDQGGKFIAATQFTLVNGLFDSNDAATPTDTPAAGA
jgi:hypothetical protein